MVRFWCQSTKLGWPQKSPFTEWRRLMNEANIWSPYLFSVDQHFMINCLRNSWQKNFSKGKKFPTCAGSWTTNLWSTKLYHYTILPSEAERCSSLCSTKHVQSFAIWQFHKKKLAEHRNVEFITIRKLSLIITAWIMVCEISISQVNRHTIIYSNVVSLKYFNKNYGWMFIG